MEIEAEVPRELPVIDFADLPPFVVVSSEPETVSPFQKVDNRIVLGYREAPAESRFGGPRQSAREIEKMIGSSMVTSRRLERPRSGREEPESVLLQELIFEGQIHRVVFFLLGIFKLIEPSNWKTVGWQ
jgi:hypothetical protein